MPLLTATSCYPGMTREQSLALDAREAIKEEQFHKIIKDNKNDIIKTIRLLNEFDRDWCEDWVDDEYYEEQKDNNTDYWKFCVRKYLYDDKYFTDKTPYPDIIQNTQGWLDCKMVGGISICLGYDDGVETLMEKEYNRNYWSWLSSYELKMLDKRMTEWHNQ